MVAAYVTPDDNGNIWVIQRTDYGPQVIELDASGVATGKVITGFSDPVSLQMSKFSTSQFAKGICIVNITIGTEKVCKKLVIQ